MKTEIETTAAPAAIGPYSQAICVESGKTVYLFGQLPIDPATGKFAGEDIIKQTRQSLENISSVLQAAGSDMTKVLKTTVYLSDMEHFGAMNQVYSEYFAAPYPARVAVEVARLPKNAMVEIDVIAQI